MIKYHINSGNNNLGSYEISLPYYGGGSPKVWFVWKDKVFKTLKGQSIVTGPQRCSFAECLLRGIAKATVNQAALYICIGTVDNYNIVLMEMTKHAFSTNAFHK